MLTKRSSSDLINLPLSMSDLFGNGHKKAIIKNTEGQALALSDDNNIMGMIPSMRKNKKK